MLHPVVVEGLVRERHKDLQRAMRPPPRRYQPRTRRGTKRQRLGWTMVELGLRLATTNGPH